MTPFRDSALPPGTLERARSGDPGAHEAIYRVFEVPVRTLARRLVPRRAAADDLAQDVFVEVLTRLSQFDGRGSFAGWVRTITVNRCLMHLRSPWQRARHALDVDGAHAWVDPAAEQAAQDRGRRLDLERALARLGPTPRVVVWLHDVEGYTHAEIGALFGATASFSKSQLARAHERLRGLLEPDGVASTCMPVSTNC
ncbi:MAG TPA: sigma-70 family RNA polymerase sigma factor [Steroidobacteraceae bacterium]|nr:sigma-70 family RNA polymerase sigma factor [Steroidobacteraceae bacterium]